MKLLLSFTIKSTFVLTFSEHPVFVNVPTVTDNKGLMVMLTMAAKTHIGIICLQIWYVYRGKQKDRSGCFISNLLNVYLTYNLYLR